MSRERTSLTLISHFLSIVLRFVFIAPQVQPRLSIIRGPLHVDSVEDVDSQAGLPCGLRWWIRERYRGRLRKSTDCQPEQYKNLGAKSRAPGAHVGDSGAYGTVWRCPGDLNLDRNCAHRTTVGSKAEEAASSVRRVGAFILINFPSSRLYVADVVTWVCILIWQQPIVAFENITCGLSSMDRGP